MPDNMFRDVVDPSIKVGGRRGYTVPCSIAVHVLVVVAVLALPLVVTNGDRWPTPPTLLAFVGAPPPPPQPPPAAAPRSTPPQGPRSESNPNVAPVMAPREITAEGPTQSNRSALTAVDGVGTSEIIGGLEALQTSPPPPPPPPPVETPRVPVRVGGAIRPPTKTKDVLPEYPPIARTARVQGVVIIEATISPTGKVLDAKILRSIPLLDAAALDAVRRWEYTPTLLNGVPVPVVMTVTISFQMG